MELCADDGKEEKEMMRISRVEKKFDLTYYLYGKFVSTVLPIELFSSNNINTILIILIILYH